MRVKWSFSRFVGKQLSRLKMAQTYYSIVTSTINTVSLISIAFKVDLILLWILFPFLLASTWVVGYYMDRKNVMTEDTLLQNDMANRFMSTSDIKAQEFQALQTEALMDALESMRLGKPVDKTVFKRKYDEYVKKWTREMR